MSVLGHNPGASMLHWDPKPPYPGSDPEGRIIGLLPDETCFQPSISILTRYPYVYYSIHQIISGAH